MRVEDENVSEVIRDKMALMHQKIAVLNTHWLEETKGLHLGPDGILLTPGGRPLHDPSEVGRREAESIRLTPDVRPVHNQLNSRGAENGVDVTQVLSSERGQWRSVDDEWCHLEDALREVS